MKLVQFTTLHGPVWVNPEMIVSVEEFDSDELVGTEITTSALMIYIKEKLEEVVGALQS